MWQIRSFYVYTIWLPRSFGRNGVWQFKTKPKHTEDNDMLVSVTYTMWKLISTPTSTQSLGQCFMVPIILLLMPANYIYMYKLLYDQPSYTHSQYHAICKGLASPSNHPAVEDLHCLQCSTNSTQLLKTIYGLH